MIYELSQDIETELQARLFPVHVEYQSRVARETFENVIVFKRDREGGDSVGPARGVNPNARRFAQRTLGVEAKVYVRSPEDGAHVGTHEFECEDLVDALLVALEEWAKENQAWPIEITSARYLSEAELNGIETWPGVVYQLKFGVPRGIYKRDFSRAARPEGAAGSVASVTHVRLPGASPGDPGDDPATGCGA